MGVVVTLGTHNSVCMQIFEFLVSLDHTIISIFPEFICLHHGKNPKSSILLGTPSQVHEIIKEVPKIEYQAPHGAVDFMFFFLGFHGDFNGEFGDYTENYGG